MTRAVAYEPTSIGTIALAYRQCDHCRARVPDDDPISWITVERTLAGMGYWTQLDFCRIEHLAEYFASDHPYN